MSVSELPIPHQDPTRTPPQDVAAEQSVIGGDVRPGNSGGPLLNEQGQVLGVVFAADAENKNTGYALAPSEVAKVVSETASLMQETQTGNCAKVS
jgi:S1-C subfamily serine protease